jgi:alpha-glucosidase
MNSTKFKVLLVVIMIVLAGTMTVGAFSSAPIDQQEVSSPNGELNLKFDLEEGVANYEVVYNQEQLIEPSSLGFKLKNNPDLTTGFKVVGTTRREVDNTWEPVWGQQSQIRNHYQHLTINLEEIEAPHRKMNLVFRVYNDGVGFRYVLPEQENLAELEIASEETKFNFTADNTTWWLQNDWNSYEYTYGKNLLSEIKPASTPVTMKTPEGSYLSIHEAALIDYAGMALEPNNDNPQTLTSNLAPWPDGVKVKGAAPLKTPWRTIQVGQNAGDLVESNLILNLNEPNKLENTDWIKPMKYIGIWWEMHIEKSSWSAWKSDHGATTENAKEYIDFAHQYLDSANQPIGLLVEGWNQGWEFGWNNQNYIKSYDDFDLREVIQYANQHGVDYIAHNETGGDVENYLAQLDDAYDLYQELGIHSIKSGYVADSGMRKPKGHNHHGQWMVNHYLDAVKRAAQNEIMINTHEPIKATGIQRTYPNWMTREGVQGMEYNAWSAGNPPEHTTILPFTRMLAGPIDYTPGIFDIEFNQYQPTNRVHTTRAKQLALYPIIFSPMQMAADLPANYKDQPEFEFIKNVPVNWDDTLVPQAQIGDYVTVVRLKGEEWYVGTITDEEPRDLEIKLDFLKEGQDYVAHIYEDSPEADYESNPTAVSKREIRVNSTDVLDASLIKSGGQAVRLVPVSKKE